jgi:actin-related protein
MFWGEILFFLKKKVYFTNSNSLYGNGFTSGLTINFAFKSTRIETIKEGITSPNKVKLDFGGENITQNLIEMLSDKISHFSDYQKYKIAEDIKKKHCFVSPTFEELKNFDNNNVTVDYLLPDGNFIQVGKERCLATEEIFKKRVIPSMSNPNFELFF